MVKVEDVFSGLMLAVILLPVAIGMYVGTDTSLWPATLKMVWDALPVLGVAGVALGFIGYVRRKR